MVGEEHSGYRTTTTTKFFSYPLKIIHDKSYNKNFQVAIVFAMSLLGLKNKLPTNNKKYIMNIQENYVNKIIKIGHHTIH